jgi:hypothetical protein
LEGEAGWWRHVADCVVCCVSLSRSFLEENKGDVLYLMVQFLVDDV